MRVAGVRAVCDLARVALGFCGKGQKKNCERLDVVVALHVVGEGEWCRIGGGCVPCIWGIFFCSFFLGSLGGSTILPSLPASLRDIPPRYFAVSGCQGKGSIKLARVGMCIFDAILITSVSKARSKRVSNIMKDQ